MVQFDDGSRLEVWMDDYITSGRIAGAVLIVLREGRVETIVVRGDRDVDRRLPMEMDTLFSIYSMTKPITALAALIAVEDGVLAIDDRVSDYLPSYGSMTVNRCGGGDVLDPVVALTPMTVRHLLTHTSGLTYSGNPGAVSACYGERRTDFDTDDGPLLDVCNRLATIPLLFEPGTAWNYGVSSDVLGCVIELATGQPLDDYMSERILAPLGMIDTAFTVPGHKVDRLAAVYEATPDSGMRVVESGSDRPICQPVSTLSGGAGLISTAADYLRFAELLRRGGELDGTRVLGEASVASMTRNQLPGDLASFGQATFNETSTTGVGYGFGGSVTIDPARSAWRSNLGEFAWGGYASTAFWVDATTGRSVVFMTQLIPSDRYAIRGELRSIINRSR